MLVSPMRDKDQEEGKERTVAYETLRFGQLKDCVRQAMVGRTICHARGCPTMRAKRSLQDVKCSPAEVKPLAPGMHTLEYYWAVSTSQVVSVFLTAER